jgi:hypothetical protein
LHDLADHLGALHIFDPHLDATVIEDQGRAARHVVNQIGIVQADALLVAQFAVGIEDEAIAVVQVDLAVLELADADLRSLQVDQDADGTAARLGQRAHQVGALDVFFRRAVREIQAHDIDARLDHPVQDLGIGTSRTQRSDNFSSA